MTSLASDHPAPAPTEADAAGPAARRGRRRRTTPGVDPIPWWLKLAAGLVAVFLIMPTLFVVPMSFGSSSTLAFPPEDFSLVHYASFFSDPNWVDSLRNSVFVALAASALATVVGTAAAVGLHQRAGRIAEFARALLMVPLVAPAIVVAVAVYISFLKWQLVGSFQGYVLAHAAIGVPFVLVSVTSALGGFDSTLLRASASLGASPLRTFRRVTMPLIGRGILSGAIFSFVTSFDEVVIALFLRAPEFQTMPVQMYNSVTYEIDPTMAAASSLVVVVVTVICFVVQFLGTRPKTR